MLKKSVLDKNENYIRTFKDIRVMLSDKKRKANFYISDKRVLLRNSSDRRALLFSDIELNEIDDVKQKLEFVFRYTYIIVSLLFTLFLALSYYLSEAGVMLYLLFPIIFFMALLGLFTKAEHTFILFLITFILIFINILILMTFEEYKIIVYILDIIAAIFFFIMGIIPDRYARLVIFITVGDFISYTDLHDMLKSGLIKRNDSKYFEDILESESTSLQIISGPRYKKKLKEIKKRISSRGYRDTHLEDNDLKDDYGLGKAVIRSKVDFRYVYDSVSADIYDELVAVIERNKEEKIESRHSRMVYNPDYWEEKRQEKRLFEETIKNINKLNTIYVKNNEVNDQEFD